MKIYILTHMACEVPGEGIYELLGVARDVETYQRADKGINIISKEPLYGELTGLYWIWKNVTDQDYVGVFQYRRFLVDEQQELLTETKCRELMQDVAIVLPKKVELQESYEEYFAKKYNLRDLQLVERSIENKSPEYREAFQQMKRQNFFYPKNLLLTGKETFDRYASWLFMILAEVEAQVDTRYYKARTFAQLAEALLMTFVLKEKGAVRTCPVQINQERAEILEMEQEIEALLTMGNIAAANQKMYDYQNQYPKIRAAVMENEGDVAVLAQVLNICQQERMEQQEKSNSQETENLGMEFYAKKGLKALLAHYRMLRQILVEPSGEANKRFFQEAEISWIAVKEALKGMNMKESYKNKIVRKVSSIFAESGRLEDAKELEKVWF